MGQITTQINAAKSSLMRNISSLKIDSSRFEALEKQNSGFATELQNLRELQRHPNTGIEDIRKTMESFQSRLSTVECHEWHDRQAIQALETEVAKINRTALFKGVCYTWTKCGGT